MGEQVFGTRPHTTVTAADIDPLVETPESLALACAGPWLTEMDERATEVGAMEDGTYVVLGNNALAAVIDPVRRTGRLVHLEHVTDYAHKPLIMGDDPEAVKEAARDGARAMKAAGEYIEGLRELIEYRLPLECRSMDAMEEFDWAQVDLSVEEAEAVVEALETAAGVTGGLDEYRREKSTQRNHALRMRHKPKNSKQKAKLQARRRNYKQHKAQLKRKHRLYYRKNHRKFRKQRRESMDVLSMPTDLAETITDLLADYGVDMPLYETADPAQAELHLPTELADAVLAHLAGELGEPLFEDLVGNPARGKEGTLKLTTMVGSDAILGTTGTEAPLPVAEAKAKDDAEREGDAKDDEEDNDEEDDDAEAQAQDELDGDEKDDEDEDGDEFGEALAFEDDDDDDAHSELDAAFESRLAKLRGGNPLGKHKAPRVHLPPDARPHISAPPKGKPGLRVYEGVNDTHETGGGGPEAETGDGNAVAQKHAADKALAGDGKVGTGGPLPVSMGPEALRKERPELSHLSNADLLAVECVTLSQAKLVEFSACVDRVGANSGDCHAYPVDESGKVTVLIPRAIGSKVRAAFGKDADVSYLIAAA